MLNTKSGDDYAHLLREELARLRPILKAYEKQFSAQNSGRAPTITDIDGDSSGIAAEFKKYSDCKRRLRRLEESSTAACSNSRNNNRSTTQLPPLSEKISTTTTTFVSPQKALKTLVSSSSLSSISAADSSASSLKQAKQQLPVPLQFVSPLQPKRTTAQLDDEILGPSPLVAKSSSLFATGGISSSSFAKNESPFSKRSLVQEFAATTLTELQPNSAKSLLNTKKQDQPSTAAAGNACRKSNSSKLVPTIHINYGTVRPLTKATNQAPTLKNKETMSLTGVTTSTASSVSEGVFNKTAGGVEKMQLEKHSSPATAFTLNSTGMIGIDDDDIMPIPQQFSFKSKKINSASSSSSLLVTTVDRSSHRHTRNDPASPPPLQPSTPKIGYDGDRDLENSSNNSSSAFISLIAKQTMCSNKRKARSNNKKNSQAVGGPVNKPRVGRSKPTAQRKDEEGIDQEEDDHGDDDHDKLTNVSMNDVHSDDSSCTSDIVISKKKRKAAAKEKQSKSVASRRKSSSSTRNKKTSFSKKDAETTTTTANARPARSTRRNTAMIISDGDDYAVDMEDETEDSIHSDAILSDGGRNNAPKETVEKKKPAKRGTGSKESTITSTSNSAATTAATTSKKRSSSYSSKFKGNFKKMKLNKFKGSGGGGGGRYGGGGGFGGGRFGKGRFYKSGFNNKRFGGGGGGGGAKSGLEDDFSGVAVESMMESALSSYLQSIDEAANEETISGCSDMFSLRPAGSTSNDHSIDCTTDSSDQRLVLISPKFYSFLSDWLVFVDIDKALHILTHSTSFLLGQREAIVKILSCENVLINLPTGLGKSLCFQLPSFILKCLRSFINQSDLQTIGRSMADKKALQIDEDGDCKTIDQIDEVDDNQWKATSSNNHSTAEHHTTLVVCPSSSAIFNRIRTLPLKLRGAALTNYMKFVNIKSVLDQLSNDQIDILFVTPDQLISQSFLRMMANTFLKIQLVCVDQAHCVSSLSHDFRINYTSIPGFLNIGFMKRYELSLFGLTTIAPRDVLEDICRVFNISGGNKLSSAASPIRKNMHVSARKTTESQSESDLVKLLKTEPFKGLKSVLIFCLFQYQADRLARFLVVSGLRVDSLHAGKTPTDRNHVIRRFESGELEILVATLNFGMAISKQDIGGVVHYCMPRSIESFIQESGLAGRTSGTDSYSHVFLTTEDYVKQRSFASRDGCNRENIDELFKLINTQPSKQSGTDFMHIIPHEQHKAFSSLDDYSNRQWKVTSLYIMETEIYLDLKELAIKTALQLAQSAEGELVKYLGEINQSYTITVSSDKSANENPLIANIFKLGKRAASNQYYVDTLEMCQALEVSNSEFVKQLFSLRRWLSFQPERRCLVVAVPVVDLNSRRANDHQQKFQRIVNSVYAHFESNERASVAKLDWVYDTFTKLAASDDLNPFDFSAAVEMYANMNEKKKEEKEKENFDTMDSADTCVAANNGPSEAEKWGFRDEALVIRAKQSYMMAQIDMKFFINANMDKLTAGRQVARIFHGIASPRYTAFDWKTSPYWSKYQSIISFAELNRLASLVLKRRLAAAATEEAAHATRS